MATGDATDITSRLRRYLPPWFGPGPTPILNTLLAGIAAALSGAYALYAFAALQIRIATATGGWLTLYAFDFFGDNLPRYSGEIDPSYSLRVREEVFRDRNTRGAIDAAVFDITGKHPHIWEGFHPAENGGFGTYGLAFGRMGRYGSRRAKFTTIISIETLQNYGIPNRGGWGSGVGGWGVGNFSLVSTNDIVGAGPTQTDIMLAVERVRAAGTQFYVQFIDPPGSGDPTP